MISIQVFLFPLFFQLFFQKESKFLEFPIDCQKDNNFCSISIYFGLHNQPFNLQLDTTSSYTWIPSTKFDLDVYKYNQFNSPKGITTNQTIEIEGEKGSIIGKLSYDSINIANMTIDNFSFALANYHDNYFKDYPKGKLGLGYDRDSKGVINFVQQLQEKNLIDKKIFIIDKFMKKLVIGKIPEYLEEVPKISFPLYNGDDLDDKNKQTWACELYKVFCGIYLTDSIQLSFDSKGNPIITNKISIDYDLSKEAFAPAVFDSTYPYIKFPKKYLNYVKGNLIIKFLEGACQENKDEDTIYFICEKKKINLYLNYLCLFINGKMFFLYGSDLFKPLKDGKYELLIRFPRKEKNHIFNIGAPFLDKWSIVYDYDKQEINLYGENFADLSCQYFRFKFWKYFWYILGCVIAFIILVILIIACIIDSCKKK